MASYCRCLIFSCLLIFSGCTVGLLYTDVTTPLTKNMHNTKVAEHFAMSSRTKVQEPLTGVGVRGEWANYAIGRTAKVNDIKTIRYADIRKESYLLGIFGKTTIHVYGTNEDDEEVEVSKVIGDEEK